MAWYARVHILRSVLNNMLSVLSTVQFIHWGWRIILFIETQSFDSCIGDCREYNKVEDAQSCATFL